MNSFNQLMAGFGVVTVMNARIYKLYEGSSYKSKGLTPFDFEDTGLYLDTLKLANFTQEGPTKVITGGQYNAPLLRYGKKTTLEMQNALGNVEVLKTFFGCDYDEASGIVSVTDKFPSSFAIEGETFFINQRTGAKEKVWIFIPQFMPDAILNLTQDAEGDAATFDCNGTVCVTNIVDTQHPEGHNIFYHIASKPWLRFGYMITPDSILDYRLKEDDTYEVAGLLVDKYDGDIVIPSVHNGKRVTSIKAWAFGRDQYGDAQQNINCYVRRVYIPSSIIKIENYAFAYQYKLEHVHFGGQSNLRIIEGDAFNETIRLQQFTMPKTVNYIGENAFIGSGACSYDHLFCYVDKWLVGYDLQDDDGLDINEFEPFRNDTIGIAEFAIPEIDNAAPLWLPAGVQYVMRQNIGACNGTDAYVGSGSNTFYAGYMCQEPEDVWAEDIGGYVRRDRPVALVCINRTPIQGSFADFIYPNDLQYVNKNDDAVYYRDVSPISIISDFYLDGNVGFNATADYDRVFWSYNSLYIDQYYGDIKLRYNRSSLEAKANGAPWTRTHGVNYGQKQTIQVICSDGITLTYEYDNTYEP